MSTSERAPGGPEAEAGLADSVRELAGRIEALQAEVRRLGGPALPAGQVGWDDDAPGAHAGSHAWVGSIEPAVRRRPAVPRLLLEGLFLAAVAAAAALADLAAPAIAGVMAGAWVLVALIEWAASHADRRRDALVLLPAPAPPEPAQADASWFVPPVEQTLLETPADSVTVVTKLPPAPQDLDDAVERTPGP